MSGSIAAAGATAAASVAGSIIAAKSAKKKRKLDAANKQADIRQRGGESESKALGDIATNLRSSLQGR